MTTPENVSETTDSSLLPVQGEADIATLQDQHTHDILVHVPHRLRRRHEAVGRIIRFLRSV